MNGRARCPTLSPKDGDKSGAPRGKGDASPQTERAGHPPTRTRDCTQRRCRYKGRVDQVEREKNRSKSRVRSRVEHVFGVMKLKFGFTKVRYRGLKKNGNRLFAICALVNLLSPARSCRAWLWSSTDPVFDTVFCPAQKVRTSSTELLNGTIINASP